MKRVSTSSGMPLTSNLINDISNYIIENISNLVKTSFKGGVIQESPTTFELIPTIVGQNIKITINPGKVVFSDGCVLTTTQPYEIITPLTMLNVGIRYNLVQSTNPNYKKEVQFEFFTSNLPIELIENQVCLGTIVIGESEINVDYSTRHYFTFSPNVQFRIKLPENSSSPLITSKYFFNQEINLADHVRAIGSGTITPKNPHGLSLKDIEGWTETKLTETHERQLHKNGFLFSPTSNKVIYSRQNAISQNITYQYIRIQFPNNSLLFLNGKTFDNSLFRIFDIFLGTFNIDGTPQALPTTNYLIALKNNELELKPYIFTTSIDVSGNFSWKFGDENQWKIEQVKNNPLSYDYLPICVVAWDSDSRSLNFQYGWNNVSINQFYPEVRDNYNVGDVKLLPIPVDLNNLNRNLLPFGWTFCNGKALYKKINSELYSIIGGTYGEDQYHFNVPTLIYSQNLGGITNYYIYIIKII
ncbi:MAG: phage tail protein [Nanopusillaceae archaeon]